MLRRCMLGLAMWAVPSVSWAQVSSERFLPAGSQLYFRWDGVAAHRGDFDKTAVGKMLKGDTGKFLTGLCDYVENLVDISLGQFEPDAAKMIKDLGRVLKGVGQHGVTVAVELKEINPPDIQATIVLHKNSETLLAFLKKAVELSRVPVKEEKVGKATVYHFEPEQGLHIGWTDAGGDAVIMIGTHSPAAIARGGKKGSTIAANPMFKGVNSFKEFPTWCRAYLDLGGIAKVAKRISPDVSKLIEELGLDGIKSLTFQSGFDGPAERSLVEVVTPGPRKGLLKLASQKPIKLADLPRMPEDITSFSASTLDLADVYDVLVQSAEAAVKIFSPNDAGKVREAIKTAEGLIGIKLREDLLGALGDVNMSYNSPAEGLLGLGAVTLVKVKDPQKLQAALEGLFKAVQGLAGIEFALKKKKYEGAELVELHFGSEFNFTTPTFTIYKGWLAFSTYPQPLKGFILRANGELTAYDIQARLGKELSKFPKEFISVSMSDPRPTVKFLLSLAPPAMSLLNSATRQFLPAGPQFDVSLIPNVHEATRYLFPNVSITTDDGRKVRMETRGSLNLPF